MKIPFIEKIGVPAKADPEKVRREQLRKKHLNLKPVIAVIVIAVILLACVSILTIIKERTKDVDSQADTSVQDSLSSAEVLAYNSTSDEQQQYINKNILLIFTKDGNKELNLLTIMNIDSLSNQVSFKYVPISAGCYVNNVNGNMDTHLENGGIKELLWAVREYTKMNIDRYIKCDEKAFTDIMKALGDFELEINENINSSYNGISYIIEKGNHNFTADAMLKYFLYLCSYVSSDTERLTEIISKIAEKTIYASESEISTSKIFSGFVKYIDTDISAMDIAKHATGLEQLISAGVLENFVSVQ
ncbi:MAG: LCP family protein [Ruminococcus sp.]|nr:LCP family protein [Ruminococcus sp.]